MTAQQLMKPMDVYSEMTIPLDIAIYCRTHRFSIESVELSRAIRKRQQANQSLQLAEKLLEQTEVLVSGRIQAVREQMERNNGF